MLKVCIQGLGFADATMTTAVSSKLDKNGRPLFDFVGIELNNTQGISRVNSINNSKFPIPSNDRKLLNEIKKSYSKDNLKAFSINHHFKYADIILAIMNCNLIVENGIEKIDVKTFINGILTLSELINSYKNIP